MQVAASWLVCVREMLIFFKKHIIGGIYLKKDIENIFY